MAFDGIITTAITKELASLLNGSKIEKIYQPEPLEVVFHIHARNGNHKLLISCTSSHPRLHLIADSPANPKTPLAFCMLLRKHLAGGRITDIAQKENERIVEISVETVNELGFSVNKKLIAEIMGKHSNMILTDASSGKIIDSIKRISIDASRVRQILPGKAYEYPPSQGKTPLVDITSERAETLCACPPALLAKSFLSGIQGISPGIAEKLAASVEGTADGPIGFGNALYREILDLCNDLENGHFAPVIYLDDNDLPLDFHVFPLPSYEGLCKKTAFDTVNGCVERYYLSKEGASQAKQKSADLERAVRSSLDKLYLKKQRLSEDLLKAESADLYRIYGELLTANLHLVLPGSDAVTVVSYYDGSEVTIPLDKRLSPSKNAQHYFKKYGKAKTAVKEKAIQLAETDEDIAYLESVESYIENAETVEEIDGLRNELVEAGYLRKRKHQQKAAREKEKSKPFTYMTSDGFRVMAGRNNRENDALTFKNAERTDIWLHTKDIPGSHVILFLEGREPSEAGLFEAASIAAWHSKGRSSENVPVDYTHVKYVKKPSGAKPGMVIFTNNKTLYVAPRLPDPQSS